METVSSKWFGLHPDLVKGIRDIGYEEPTPIQVEAIPLILDGRDVIGCAQTGTGKTAAYVLPILHRLLPGPRGRCRALILAPTRELTLQIDEQVLALGYHTGLSGAAVVGGLEMGPQERALRAGAEIVAATPGRLLDHMRFDYVRFDGLEVLVLDEADRMLDMGFLPDLMRIVGRLPRDRQTLLFSATIPPEIVRLAQDVMRDPVHIRAGAAAGPPAAITHAIYPVPEHLKEALLVALLRGGRMTSVLAFTRTKRQADRLARVVQRAGIPVSRLHSDRSQAERIEALEGFRRGTYRVLVATDVAARGLDVEGISHVINFDVPETADDYIHRIGRTARVDATGDAITLVAPGDARTIREIERAMGRPLPRATLPGFDYKASPREGAARAVAPRRGRRGGARHGSQGSSSQRRGGQGPGRPRGR